MCLEILKYKFIGKRIDVVTEKNYECEALSECRLGSVILHKENENYNIVDGQQRLTTLSILLYCLRKKVEDKDKDKDKDKGLLNKQFSSLSANAIINNFKILTKKVSELKEREPLEYMSYLFKRCTVVKIVTDKEQEAFQFFDSQNSRGKELAPHDLLEKVQKKINNFHKDVAEIPSIRSGDIYIKQLYESVLLFFADRFDVNLITDSVMKQLYTWSYSLRFMMTAVYPQTINKYAIGKHERINKELKLFAKISEMIEPEELNLIIFEKIDEKLVKNNLKKYPKIWKFLRKANGW